MLGNVPQRIFFEVFIMVGKSDLHCCKHLEGFRTNFSSPFSVFMNYMSSFSHIFGVKVIVLIPIFNL